MHITWLNDFLIVCKYSKGYKCTQYERKNFSSENMSRCTNQ